MQLRDHPLMVLRGVRSWPPIWTNRNMDKPKLLKGEIGTLIDTYTVRGDSCFLVIEHESETYVGALLLEDTVFCRRVCDLLKQKVGQSISQIGDLDLSLML